MISPSGFCFRKISGISKEASPNPSSPGTEYLTNTVRKHPSRPGYIQVYDQKAHAWSDVRENYFWEFQQKKKQILGSDYQEPLVI